MFRFPLQVNVEAISARDRGSQVNATRGLVHRDTPVSSADDKQKEPPQPFLAAMREAELFGPRRTRFGNSIDSDKARSRMIVITTMAIKGSGRPLPDVSPRQQKARIKAWVTEVSL